MPVGLAHSKGRRRPPRPPVRGSQATEAAGTWLSESWGPLGPARTPPSACVWDWALNTPPPQTASASPRATSYGASGSPWGTPNLSGSQPAQASCPKAAVQHPSKASVGRKGPRLCMAPRGPGLSLVHGPCPWSVGPVPGLWALSMEGNPPVQRLGGVEEWPPGCRLLEAPTARPSLLLRSWVGDSSTHSNPQKDRPSPSKSQGAQLCFWGPPALASARPLLQSTCGQRPPFPSTSHCGGSMQGQAQVSRGRSATGPRVHKLLLECNCI